MYNDEKSDTPRGSWLVVGVIFVAIFINSYFGTDAVFIAMGAMTAASAIFLGRNGGEYTILAMVLWFAAGYRTFTLFGGYKIHMLDLIPLFLVFILLIGHMPGEVKALKPEYRQQRRFIIFGVISASIYGLILAIWNGVPIQDAIMLMKNVIVIVPMILFVPRILQNHKVTTRIMWMLAAAGLIISVPAILEYNLGIFSHGSSYSDAFNRALFSFWGATMAVLVLALCVQAHWYLWAEATKNRVKILLLISTVIQLYAIYISGTRQVWIALLVMVTLAIYLRLGIWKAFVAVPIFLGLLTFAPPESVQRMESFYFLKEKDQYGRADTRWLDSSGADRAVRMENAMGAMRNHPFGGGWASSGWVHSDILSVGADLGVVPGMIFILLLLFTTFKVILRTYRNSGKEQWHWLTYAGFMVTNVVLFSFGGVIWLIQYAMPAWFTWILAEYHLYHSSLDTQS